MKLYHLIAREIGHRRMPFALAVLAVAVAGMVLVAADIVVKRNSWVTDQVLAVTQAETETLLATKEAAVAKAGADLEDTIREQMKEMGFNVLILPEQQDPSELHLTGGLSETMPASYAQRLGDSTIMTINHLLPTVLKRVHWPEQDMEIVIYGTRGQVPLMHRAMKKPIMDAVAPGRIVVGWNVHQKLGLEIGQSIELLGHTFEVSQLHPERGSIDDVTVWINLEQAQEMLGLQNLLHAILALECECTGDRISEIRREIGEILPGTQVIERYSQALARAEARTKAKQVAEDSLAREQAAAAETLANTARQRQHLEDQHRRVAAVVIPLVLAVVCVSVGVMAYNNTRQRREEIGILRALGLRTRDILFIFLGKAVLIGLIGGVLGVLLGLLCGQWGYQWLSASPWSGSGQAIGLDAWQIPGLWWTAISTPVLAVVLATMASWVAAALAARLDAAVTLQAE